MARLLNLSAEQGLYDMKIVHTLMKLRQLIYTRYSLFADFQFDWLIMGADNSYMIREKQYITTKMKKKIFWLSMSRIYTEPHF